MSKLATSTDITYNTLRTIYRNPYRQVTTTTLKRLARALEVPFVRFTPEISRHTSFICNANTTQYLTFVV